MNWNDQIEIKDTLQESNAACHVAKLIRDRLTARTDLESDIDFLEVVDAFSELALDETCLACEVDAALDLLYDWADSNGVWIQ